MCSSIHNFFSWWNTGFQFFCTDRRTAESAVQQDGWFPIIAHHYDYHDFCCGISFSLQLDVVFAANWLFYNKQWETTLWLSCINLVNNIRTVWPSTIGIVRGWVACRVTDQTNVVCAAYIALQYIIPAIVWPKRNVLGPNERLDMQTVLCEKRCNVFEPTFAEDMQNAAPFNSRRITQYSKDLSILIFLPLGKTVSSRAMIIVIVSRSDGWAKTASMG